MGDVIELRPSGGIDSSGRTEFRQALVEACRKVIQTEMDIIEERVSYEDSALWGNGVMRVITLAERAFQKERDIPESVMWMTEAATYETVLEAIFEPYRKKAE